MTMPPVPYPDGHCIPSALRSRCLCFYRGRVARGSAVPGYPGFPTQCPGTGGARFKSHPSPALAGRQIHITRHPPHALPPESPRPPRPPLSQSPAPCPSGWHPHILSRKALCARLELVCSVSHPLIFRKGPLIFPRGTSAFPPSILVVGLTLSLPQVAM